jgi:hypothetical protein
VFAWVPALQRDVEALRADPAADLEDPVRVERQRVVDEDEVARARIGVRGGDLVDDDARGTGSGRAGRA